MRIEFQDDGLRRLYEEPGSRTPRFGTELLRSYRKVLGIVQEANDERDLRAMKSLHFEKLKGDRIGQYSLQIYQKWRLVFLLATVEGEQQIVIIEVVDYH